MDDKENLNKWISEIDSQLKKANDALIETRQLQWRKRQLEERLAKERISREMTQTEVMQRLIDITRAVLKLLENTNKNTMEVLEELEEVEC